MLLRYLGSTKNLAGSVAGLFGVLLYLLGVAGDYWLLVVAGLYGAGALLAPPEKVRLVLTDPDEEAGRLRADLDRLLGTVGRHTGRMPEGTVARMRSIGDVLAGLLDRPAELAKSPDVLHNVTRLVRVDIPLSVETYLNLPWWFAAAKRAGGERSAADELAAQLELLEADAKRIADDFYATDVQRQSDHTRYLRDRTEEPPR
jgi:hypothetical protein